MDHDPQIPAAEPKTHPATREMLPDDPLEMQAFEVEGDPDLMLRLLFEEYARLGIGLESMLDMARRPEYSALHGLWRLYGEEELRRRAEQVVSRCGLFRVTAVEAPRAEDLVQIDLPFCEDR